MNHVVKLGILGPGKIARVVADALSHEPSIELYAVGSTSYERAIEFKEHYHMKKAYGSYIELVKDEDVELIYIATPHAFHYEHMKLCLTNGKHIVCEKAFTLSTKDAIEIFKLAEEKHLFITEAMVPAYLPSTKVIDELLAQQVIGDIIEVYACFGVNLMHVDRVVKKELGGGAMYDIGIYPLFFFLNHFGFDSAIQDKQVEYQNNVDIYARVTLLNKNKIKGVIETRIDQNIGIYGIIKGTKGSIYIENIARPEFIVVKDNNNQIIKRFDSLRNTSGYEYEFRGATEAIIHNQIQTLSMPHFHSIKLLQLIEEIINIS
jgi:predicted dehydrogenase